MFSQIPNWRPDPQEIQKRVAEISEGIERAIAQESWSSLSTYLQRVGLRELNFSSAENQIVKHLRGALKGALPVEVRAAIDQKLDLLLLNPPFPRDRIEGMLLGLHAGDSLGAPLEFLRARDKDNWLVNLEAGGLWRKGEATDDTDLAMQLLESIVDFGRFDAFDYAERLVRWKRSNPKDIGITTQSAIANLEMGISPTQSGIQSPRAQGNGSLMRVAPLVLVAHRSQPNREQIIRSQCQITHGMEVCGVIDEVFLDLLEMILQSHPTHEQVLHAAIHHPKLKNFPDIIEALRRIPFMEWEEVNTSGYLVHTFQAALWSFYHHRTFEETLIAIVNRGQDADTVGAVTGALAGAYYGRAAIPDRWLADLEQRERILSLVEKAFRHHF